MTAPHEDNDNVAPHATDTQGLALCAGVGGLELGIRLALGPTYRTVGYVERDAHAASVLVARMEDQALDRAPIWDDLETFDGRPWRGRVDLVSAGFPCQPFSSAGGRRGVDDPRWLWPHIVRILTEVNPTLAYFENVPPLASEGLDVVLGDLARLGFDAEWSCLGASAVGATHRRDRLWILAHTDSTRLERCFHRISQRRQGPSTRGRETPLWPPRPDDHRNWAAAAAAGDPQPSVCRMADGLANRVDRLHTIGNGVVPLVAAHAFLGLARRVAS